MSRAKLFLLFFIILFFPITFISASNPLEVVINEIAWMGMEIGWRYEWIEIYNNTNQEIDITNWEIENSKAKNGISKISQGKIPAKGFFIICKTQIEKCDLIFSKLSFHNEYENNGKLILRDEQGDIIDKTPDANDKKWPAGDNKTKQTMERKNPLISGSSNDNWQTSQNPGGTPKAKNSLIETITENENEYSKKLEKTEDKENKENKNEEILNLEKDEKDNNESKDENKDAEIIKGNISRHSTTLTSLLIAFGIAIASAITILILKKFFKERFEETE